MDIVTGIFFLHLFGALVTGVVCVAGIGSFLGLYKFNVNKLLYSLSLLTLFQVISGAVLSLAQSTSVFHFCSRVFVYVAIVGTVQTVLFFQKQAVVNKQQLLLPHATSVVVSLVTVLLLV